MHGLAGVRRAGRRRGVRRPTATSGGSKPLTTSGRGLQRPDPDRVRARRPRACRRPVSRTTSTSGGQQPSDQGARARRGTGSCVRRCDVPRTAGGRGGPRRGGRGRRSAACGRDSRGPGTRTDGSIRPRDRCRVGWPQRLLRELTSHVRRPRRCPDFWGTDRPWARLLGTSWRQSGRTSRRRQGDRHPPGATTENNRSRVPGPTCSRSGGRGALHTGENSMAVVTMRQLLESGVHFGHQTRRWNPKMKRFIMTERNGIYIIDLQQSLAYIDRSYAFIKETVAKGGTIMFVGTKKQAQEAIAEQATRVGMPYVNQRWLGGMLTNFQTVHQRINRLKELDEIDFDDVAGQRPHQEGAAADAPRARQAQQVARRHPRDDPHPRRGLDRRHQQGAPRRRGGPQAADPDRRHPGLQLRPRPRRLPDPGQRRRDPRRRPADPRRRRRRRRGPDRPLRRQGRRCRGRRRGAAGRLGARAAGR